MGSDMQRCQNQLHIENTEPGFDPQTEDQIYKVYFKAGTLGPNGGEKEEYY